MTEKLIQSALFNLLKKKLDLKLPILEILQLQISPIQ
ncbi:MAG: hypothetical protein K940chlam8_00595 [Chlamydiae bacterium]|nr:hypothetical protein [Chlamydiota bacterium]